jgi:hypothetical protein
MPFKIKMWGVLLLVCGVPWTLPADERPVKPEGYFRIRVVDEASGRGIPLVELETVHHVRFVTDSNGLIAVHEPELMGERIHFSIRSHGYEAPRDGFGIAGRAFDVRPGESVEIKLKRTNVAERLYRITGQGIYRDSVLLGAETPLAEPLGSGKVAGQDSAFAVPYRGKVYWFWGDTGKLGYPLGHFWMAGAVSDLPEQGGLDPSEGVDLRYFTDETGFSRPMCRLGVERGLIWADTFATVTDRQGRERLVCRYAHMESLQKMLGHGFALYNDETEEFDRVRELDLEEKWRFPAQAHPIHITHGDREYLQFGGTFPVIRVPAELDAFLDLEQYEYFTCLREGSTADSPEVERDPEGELHYRWARNVQPMNEEIEWKLLEAGVIQPEEARFIPVDAAGGERIRLHRGLVRWNEHRERWVLIASQLFGTSPLGEVWYADADDPTGPWEKGVKVVTHEKYSFYNPVQHDFFDQEGGRFIYFEGTYTTQFSGNERPTPRYDYNQIMYRLDLDDPRLHLK